MAHRRTTSSIADAQVNPHVPADSYPTPVRETASVMPFRLTIAHLLLWTAATAFVVSIFPRDWLRMSLPLSGDMTAEELVARQRLFEKWSIVAVAPFYGAALTSVAIAGSRLLQRRTDFPAQPGHWLLVQTGLGVMAASCFVASNNDLFSFSTAELHAVRRTYGVIVLGLLAGLTMIGFVACRAIQEPWRWRMLLKLQAAVTIVPLVVFLVATTDTVPTNPPSLFRLVIGLWALAAAAAVIVAARDLVRRSRYDLFHYAGVVAPAVMLLHPFVTRWIAERAP